MDKLIACAMVFFTMGFAELIHTVCKTIMYFIRKDESTRKTASDATDAAKHTKEDK